MKYAVPLLCALLPGAVPARAAPEPSELSVPVRVRVAECQAEGAVAPVRPPEWVAARLDSARAILARYGVLLEFEQQPFTPRSCEFLDAEARDSAAEAVPMDGRVDVLVVARVRDLELPSYDLRGVHWRYSGSDAAYRGRRWVFLTARAEPPVLAHELCHFFGLPHDPQGGNLMSPGPSSPEYGKKGQKPFAPVLMPGQVKRLRAGVQRFLKSKQ